MKKEKIVFSFVCNGEELILEEPEYGIVDYEGIESTDYEMETAVNVNAIGEQLRRKKILSRPITVEFDYLGREEKKSHKRQELIRFFSPFRSGTLKVNYMGVERTIKYEVTGFKISSKNTHDTLSCLLELSCMDPMFEDILQSSEQISTWVGGWSFPFTLPFQLKERGEPRTNIINSGHVETPIQVEFHGPAKKPYIKNLTTGKIIQIEADLNSNQTLYVDTTFGKNTVEIEENGARTDVSQLISVESRFLRLQVGDNMVEYGAEDALQDNNVVIRYHNRYLGV